MRHAEDENQPRITRVRADNFTGLVDIFVKLVESIGEHRRSGSAGLQARVPAAYVSGSRLSADGSLAFATLPTVSEARVKRPL